MTVRAVLVDLGGPVLNEDAEYAAWARFLQEALAAEGIAVAGEEFAREVERGIGRCDPNPYLSAVWAFLRPDVERFRRIRNAFREHAQALAADLPGVEVRPEAQEVIPLLADQYLLAIAANQPITVCSLLERVGLLHHFRWRYVSEEMGIAKPSPLFFRMILDGLGVEAAEAVMVGDRLDFDVYPARLLGMKTVRVLVGPYAGQEPPTPWHVPERTVASLAEVPSAVAEIEGGGAC